MPPPPRKWRQPQVQIVAGAQHAIDQVGDDARVVPVPGQHVDVRRLRAQLRARVGERDGLALVVEELDAC